MGVFRKIYAFFHDDCCSQCQTKMEERKRQLYRLPMMVGHYTSHADAEYYKRHLMKVHQKADIPVGNYACGMIVYECPECGHRPVKLSIFLPVRDEEKHEETLYFDNGEMEDFIK